ncbi:MAG: sulfatase-like hydrolase/transferase [Verrucomicrobiales bacterium]|nr:sulfatase-like hydrolase/transferase [Verrucomicrobiales bacterium]
MSSTCYAVDDEQARLIFTSDNGGLYHWWQPQETDDLKYYRVNKRGRYVKEFGHQGNAHLRGTKADIWEGGHRVPFIVRWPGKTPAGTVGDELIELTDLLATCAAITGAEIPKGAAEDSRNVLPALLGMETVAPLRDYAVHHSLWGMFAIRKGDWKLVEGRGSGGLTHKREIDPEKDGGSMGQLYDLKKDPSETKNVWQQHPEVVEELRKLLEKVKADDA